jgi:hypothetical protein
MAGEQIQLKAGAVKAAEYNSPSMPGKEEEAGKKAIKLGDCLPLVSKTQDGRWQNIPVRKSRHYLRLYVFLNLCPWFSILWWSNWQQLFEVSWFHIRDDSPVCYRLVIIGNWGALAVRKQVKRRESGHTLVNC